MLSASVQLDTWFVTKDQPLALRLRIPDRAKMHPRSGERSSDVVQDVPHHFLSRLSAGGNRLLDCFFFRARSTDFTYAPHVARRRYAAYKNNPTHPQNIVSSY